MCYIIFVVRLFWFYSDGSCILCYIIFVIRWFEQKQPYDKYDKAQNTGTIAVEQKQPNDKYDIAQNTGTIPVEQKQRMTNMI
jgi:hypothetical protein